MKHQFFLRVHFLAIFSLFAWVGQAQAGVTTCDLVSGGPDCCQTAPATVVSQIMAGGLPAGVTIVLGSAAFVGNPIACGTFTDTGVTGLPNGGILGTGNIYYVRGGPIPGTFNGSCNWSKGGVNCPVGGYPGPYAGTCAEPMLNIQKPNYPTTDRATLTWQLSNNSGSARTFQCNLVFASEEWPEYSKSGKNDVSGVFVGANNIARI